MQAIKSSTSVDPTGVLLNLYLPFVFSEYFQTQRIETMLDVGCSVGFISNTISTFVDQLYAFDLSPEAIKIAKENAAKTNSNVHYFTANALEPLTSPVIKDLKFDFIIILNLHPFNRNVFSSNHEATVVQAEAINQYCALLNENGILYISHTDGKKQTLNIQEKDLPQGAKLLAGRMNARLVMLLSQVLKRKMGIILILSKILSPLFNLVAPKVDLWVIQKTQK
jgi:SAM-dependent methyltransferase